MMLEIGNNLKSRVMGFTFIEILIAMVILSLGVVIIYETFFVCIDLFSYYADYLKLGLVIEEKLWQIKDILRHKQKSEISLTSEGNFLVNNKNYFWDLNYDLIDKEAQLYRIDLRVYGQAGKRKVKFLRNAYVNYAKNEK